MRCDVYMSVELPDDKCPLLNQKHELFNPGPDLKFVQIYTRFRLCRTRSPRFTGTYFITRLIVVESEITDISCLESTHQETELGMTKVE